MKTLTILTAICAVTCANAASAHDFNATYATRGECEDAFSHMTNAERDWLLVIDSEYFDTRGEVTSFLTHALQCELNDEGLWQISDGRVETIDSEWWLRRNP